MRVTLKKCVKLFVSALIFWWIILGIPEARAAAPPEEWWDPLWLSRQKITIDTTAAVPNGYTVSLTFDHWALVDAGKSLDNGDDIRVVYWDGSGSTWVELDRWRDLDTTWNNASADTTIWFKIQAAISASGSDDNYYLYYNNLSATNPPDDGSNVFLFYDDFEGGALPGPWDGVWTGDGTDDITITTSTVHTGTYAVDCYADDVYENQACVVEGIAAQTGISTTGWFYLPNDYTDGDYVSFTRLVDNGWAGGASLNIYDDRELYITEYYNGQDWYFSGSILSKGQWHRLEMNFLISETSGRAELWLDGGGSTGGGSPIINESGLNTGTALIDNVMTGYFYGGASVSNTIYCDNNFQRIWVDPEPTTGLSPEECPTVVELISFTARGESNCVKIEWVTETELDNEGFNLWRREWKDGEYIRINPYFIPAQGEAGFGAEYSYTDYYVQNGTIYYYKLEDIDIYGKSTFHGPVPAILNDIIIIWPPDWEVLPSDALLFSWSSSGSYSFKVEMSTHSSFPASDTLSFPEQGWTSDSSLWLSLREWKLVLSKAHQSGGKLFWRVKARSGEGRVICSDWKKFMIDF